MIGNGAIPSLRPPAVTTGPKTVALEGSNCPDSSTHTTANQCGTFPSSSRVVELPAADAKSIGSERARALVISCWTAQILVNWGSNSWQADHSAVTVPGTPPDDGWTLSHSGGDGTSSVGVALPSHETGSPRLPSGYSIAIAALYCLWSDRGTSEPLLFPV